MKKIYTYLILPVLLAFCLVACSEDEPAVPEITLKGSDIMNVETAGGTLKLEFQSTYPWTASCDERWCVMSQESGEGGSASLSLAIEPNEGFRSRVATITLRSENIFCKVKILQTEHGAVTLVVKHNLQSFKLPTFVGTEDIVGTVQWGDGKQDDYKSGLSHDYADSKERSTTISIKHVESVSLDDITGIMEIDFSAF